MCGRLFVAKNGILVSPNYPTYAYEPQCLAHIVADNSSVIKAYVLDMLIRYSCHWIKLYNIVKCQLYYNYDNVVTKNRDGVNKDKITFSDMGSITNVFLGKKSCMFAIETCTNRLDIKLEMKENLTNNNDLKGAMIYYERELFIGTIYTCSTQTT